MLVLSRKPRKRGGDLSQSLIRIGETWVMLSLKGGRIKTHIIAPGDVSVLRGDATGVTIPPEIVTEFTAEPEN